jgi:hypothetical protein
MADKLKVMCNLEILSSKGNSLVHNSFLQFSDEQLTSKVTKLGIMLGVMILVLGLYYMIVNLQNFYGYKMLTCKKIDMLMLKWKRMKC